MATRVAPLDHPREELLATHELRSGVVIAAGGSEDVAALIRRVRAGDREAFEPLYRANAGRVYALCRRMSGDRIEAAQLTQDVFVRVWERLNSYRGESAFSTWIHRVAVNVVLEQRRALLRRVARVAPSDDMEGLDPPGSPDRPDERMDIEAAIAALPVGAREVLVLHDIEGYSHGEIAKMTGLAGGTVRAQLWRARQTLARKLA